MSHVKDWARGGVSVPQEGEDGAPYVIDRGVRPGERAYADVIAANPEVVRIELSGTNGAVLVWSEALRNRTFHGFEITQAGAGNFNITVVDNITSGGDVLAIFNGNAVLDGEKKSGRQLALGVYASWTGTLLADSVFLLMGP